MDREIVLRKAERLIRQGRLDQAIAEYVRLAEHEPDDWATINVLGDLYLRAGELDRAVEQFVRVADHVYRDGFASKAAALYRKALKVRSTDEHTLLRLADITTRQGLSGEARQYLRQVLAQRRQRGDEAGMAACALRLGLLEDADAESMLAAARAAQVLKEPVQAVALYKSAADRLQQEGRAEDARAALVDAARLDPSDVRLRARLVREAVDARELDRVREFLSGESAGDDPDLLLALGRLELAAGREGEAFAILTRFITVAPEREHDLLVLAEELAEDHGIAAGYGCVEIVADAALLASDWQRAVRALRTFAESHAYIPALVKLADIAGEAGLGEIRTEAQVRLTDAYIEAGRAAEARDVAEALVAADPLDEAHRRRLRVALTLLNTPDTHASEVLISPEAGESETLDPFDPLDLLMVTEPLDVTDAGQTWPPGAADAMLPLDFSALTTAFESDPEEDARPDPAGIIEVDLSDQLGNLSSMEVDGPSSAPDPESPLDAVFEDLHRQSALDEQFAGAQEDYARGLEALEQGRVEAGAAALAAAARAPLLRFAAAARLGHLSLERGDLRAATEWFEQAAAAPPPTEEQGFDVFYGLADALERSGEADRALAVLIELAATGGAAYRDVRQRIDRLRQGSTSP